MSSALLREIATLNDLDPLQAVVDAALRLTAADRAILILFDWEHRQVSHFLRGGPGWTEVMTTVSFEELLAGLSGWVLKTGELAVSPKDFLDPRETPESQQRRRETHCGAILVAPLFSQKSQLGTLTVINRADQPDFTPDQIESLGLFSHFATRTIQLSWSQEEAQKATREARAAVQSKMNFLANLSHELRTPLNGILGFSHLLETTALDPQQKTMVHTVVQSGQRLLDTVNNLLELALFESGQFQLESSPFSPRAVLDAILAKNQAAADKALTWTVWVSPELPPVLDGDAVRLGQAWNHILSNAVKFTEVGTIEVRLLSHETGAGRHEVVLMVSDTGIGLSFERSGQWFSPFHQEDGSLTRKFGGTGLGLALCDRIVRRMGGGLTLQGEPGNGTKVKVWVNLGTDRGLSPEVGHLRVLLQDSDPVGQLVLVKLLEKAGHWVDVASDLVQAEARLWISEYDVVVIEGALGDAETLERWKKNSPHGSFQLIGLYPLGTDPHQPWALPWTATLVKPATFRNLEAVMKKCTRNRP